MFLTGLADEAGADIETQIRATRELGWAWIEARMVGEKNIHDISDAEFDHAAGKLEEAGIKVNCFGSAIANWGKKIGDPESISFDEARRAIPRMRRLGTKMIRVMSYQVDTAKDPEEQGHEERFRRLRELNTMFADAGIQMAHENCWNWGGMGWRYTLRLLDAVPGLKLIFDIGNPVGMPDFAKPEPRPRQSAWEFYEHVRSQVVHVQAKDGVWDAQKNQARWCLPGEGEADLRRILKDLAQSGYQGGLCIEPHLNFEYADPTRNAGEERFQAYLDYGRRFEAMVREEGGTIHGQ